VECSGLIGETLNFICSEREVALYGCGCRKAGLGFALALDGQCSLVRFSLLRFSCLAAPPANSLEQPGTLCFGFAARNTACLFIPDNGAEVRLRVHQGFCGRLDAHASMALGRAGR